MDAETFTAWKEAKRRAAQAAMADDKPRMTGRQRLEVLEAPAWSRNDIRDSSMNRMIEVQSAEAGSAAKGVGRRKLRLHLPSLNSLFAVATKDESCLRQLSVLCR